MNPPNLRKINIPNCCYNCDWYNDYDPIYEACFEYEIYVDPFNVCDSWKEIC